MRPHPILKRADERAVTLIELMVAMVVGMLLMAVIASVLSTSEGTKRTQTGVNDTSQAGNYAAYIIDQWVRAAGSGFNQTAARSYGCPLAASKSGAAILPLTSSLPSPFSGISGTIRLAPLLIIPGATTPNISGNSSDGLLIMEGAAGGAESYTPLTAVPAAGALTVKNSVGYSGDDIILLIDQLSSTSNTATCAIEQVTSGFSTVTTSIPLSGTYHIGGSTLTGMTDSTVISNLGNITNGNAPRFMVVGVGNNNVLYAYDLLQTGSSTLSAVAEGVFEMHAIYGVDTNADSKVDTWAPADSGTYAYSTLTNGTSVSAGLLQNIKAIRLGLILRSPLRERLDSASKPTTSTPDSYSFFSGYCSNCTVTRTFTTDEKQFRYRKIEITIPLRNNLVL